jgi:PKD repeat protein
MAGKNYPISFPQGAPFTRTFTVAIDSTPWDFDGYTARMQVRESFDSAEPTLTLTTEDGGITFGVTPGEFTVTVDAETSEDTPAGNYVYDLEVESDDGTVTRLLPTAPFTVTPGVTRD